MKTEHCYDIKCLIEEKKSCIFWFSLISFRLGSDNANDEISQAHLAHFRDKNT